MPSLFDTVTDLIDAELRSPDLDEERRSELTADREILVDHSRLLTRLEAAATVPEDGRCRICVEGIPCSVTRQISEKYI
ncbi:hypothetical protein [Kribbella sp. NPDC003557]|uniref:hypothetical protein n=1 Tax=Kribbella sp. NPDC003557 TaxID=3154449 RepID=UPI0033A7A6AA